MPVAAIRSRCGLMMAEWCSAGQFYTLAKRIQEWRSGSKNTVATCTMRHEQPREVHYKYLTVMLLGSKSSLAAWNNLLGGLPSLTRIRWPTSLSAIGEHSYCFRSVHVNPRGQR